MGDLSGAAIEPDIQTEACDATMAIPGVMLAGVPGGSLSLTCDLHEIKSQESN